MVQLDDGRGIAVDDVGDPAGVPILYLHGSPDCRLARHPDDGVAGRLGIRLLAVDRPGYGASDPQPSPDVTTWAADAAALLDHLGVDRCRVAAWSAGAPFAFGLAAELADRIERVVTFGALAPFEALAEPEVAAASGARADVAATVRAGTPVAELAAEFADLLVPPPPVDLDLARAVVLEQYDPAARAEVESVAGVVDQLARSFATAVERHGAAGLHADLAIQFSPGLTGVLAAVRCPVVLVHGEHDPVAGPAVGHWLAGRFDDARVEVWTGHGHQGLLPGWERWLGAAQAAQ